MEAEPAGELGDAGFALAVAEGEQERRGAIDRADSVAVKNHRHAPSVVVQPAAGCAWAPWPSAATSAVGAPLEGRVERVAEDRDDPVGVVALGVGLAEEPRLARVGLGHRAAGEHPQGDRVVELVVGVGPVAVLGRGLLGEEDPEHRRMAGEGVGQALARSRTSPRPAWIAAAERVDLLEGVRIPEDRQRLDGRRGRDPVAGVRPAVADVVREDAHDLAAATEGRRRVAVAHRLGERRQVRRDPEELGRAAAGEPEAGLDLVEDQDRAELLRQRPNRLVEARLGHDRLGVAEDRLDDDPGDVVAVALEDPAEHVQGVVAGRDDRLRRRPRGSRGPRPARPGSPRRRAPTCRPA